MHCVTRLLLHTLGSKSHGGHFQCNEGPDARHDVLKGFEENTKKGKQTKAAQGMEQVGSTGILAGF